MGRLSLEHDAEVNVTVLGRPSRVSERLTRRLEITQGIAHHRANRMREEVNENGADRKIASTGSFPSLQLQHACK